MKKFKHYVSENKQKLSVYITMFFLLAGVLQYALGWTYVLRLTPLVIGVMAALVILFWGPKHDQRLKASVIAITVGLITEIIGVNTGILFGNYEYSASALGFKILGVPLMVGVMWLLVTASAWQISLLGGFSKLPTIILASGMVVIFDLLLEQYATRFGLWSWEGGVIPLLNYATWFFVAMIIFIAYSKTIDKKHISLYGIMAIPMMMGFFWLMLIFA